MGILDDAIREHLELKRAHGASDDEVSRKEAEVFGPPRREVAETPLDGDATQMLEAPAHDLEPEPLQASGEGAYAVRPGDHPVPDPHDHAHPAGADPAWAEDTEFFSEPAAPPEPPPAAPDHDHDEEPHPALHDHDAIPSEEYAPEPAFRREATAPAVPPPVEEPPIAEPPIAEPPVEEPPVVTPGEEDVLEETPEFLQDAPEHDRLWFEQKPPRDFDFGE
jgi:hypothetical protein